MVWIGRLKLDASRLHMNARSEVDLIRRKFLQDCLVIGKYSCRSPFVKVVSIYQRGIYMKYLRFQCCGKKLWWRRKNVVNLVIDLACSKKIRFLGTNTRLTPHLSWYIETTKNSINSS